MVADLNPPSYFSQLSAARTTASSTHGARAYARSSHQKLSRAEHEAQFEREHGSLWTPGLLDRLSLPLSRIHE